MQITFLALCQKVIGGEKGCSQHSNVYTYEIICKSFRINIFWTSQVGGDMVELKKANVADYIRFVLSTLVLVFCLIATVYAIVLKVRDIC